MSEFVSLDIEKIDPPSETDRDLIDPDKVRELAESIRSQGLLQAILVRPFNGRYEIVAGHRRYLAHRLIGWVKIDSIIREMTDDQVFEARLVENDQREDLNPIERAKRYANLRARFGYSNRQIAQKMGRSPGVVDKYFKLLDIPDEFKDAVAHRKLSMQVALYLNEIEDVQFKNFYFQSAVDNGITVEVAQAWVSDWKKSKAGVAYADGGGVPLVPMQQQEMIIYVTCNCCLGPVESKFVKYIGVCPDCASHIAGALRDQNKNKGG